MTENHTRSAADSYPARFLPLLLILFAGSGCCALIYEIVWYQLLQFVIGSSAVSLGVLLSTFMGGLCLGSLAFSRIPQTRRYHPLRLFAAMEAGIGLCGILVLFGMPVAGRIYVAAAGHGLPAILLRAAICSICLLPPTALMGASLPAIARWVEATPRGVSWLGLLYGGNTLGAVFGCLLAGFYLLRVFDMAVATYVGVTINLIVALAGFLLSERTPDHLVSGGLPEAASEAASKIRAEQLPASDRQFWPIYITMALSGASALGAEVVWTRMLGLILGATVYTFSIILAVFLLGLGIGSGAGALLSLVVRAETAIGYCQLLLTAAIAWTAFMLAKSLPYWPIDPRLSSSPWFSFQIDLVRALWAILPAALLWGASFPFALAAVASEDDDRARPVGGIYAANTGGAILGALGFSMFLIPRVGTRDCERILIVLAILGALFALAPLLRTRRAKFRALGLSASVAAALVLAALVPPVPAALIAFGRLFLAAGGTQILYAAEGLNSSIAISQSGNVRQFHVSGKIEASTGGYDMRLQRMLGDMPALLHAKPRSVLVVGFGAGITAGSFVVDPDVRRIVICELEPLVPPAATRYFDNENYDVLHDPRTEMIYEDARNFILTTPEKFDVITSDPIHPWVKGSAALYTKEYFELVKRHLNPGGIATQWVPLYETDLKTVKSEIATFFAVFPNGAIWANEGDGNGYDLVLLGQAGPMRIDVDALQRRLDRPDYAGVANSLRDVGLNSALELLATYAGQAADLKPWLKDAEINRDGNLRLQYLAGLAVNSNGQGPIYSDMLRYRRFPENLIVGSSQNIQVLRHQHDDE